jgi:hypothetical protein
VGTFTFKTGSRCDLHCRALICRRSFAPPLGAASPSTSVEVPSLPADTTNAAPRIPGFYDHHHLASCPSFDGRDGFSGLRPLTSRHWLSAPSLLTGHCRDQGEEAPYHREGFLGETVRAARFRFPRGTEDRASWEIGVSKAGPGLDVQTPLTLTIGAIA